MSEFDGRLRGSYAGLILLHGELRIPYFNANLVLDLLDTHLGLAEFQFRAHLCSLGRAVAYGNVQRGRICR